jgi:hypothetical protein
MATYVVSDLKDFQHRLVKLAKDRPKDIFPIKCQLGMDGKTASLIWRAPSLDHLKIFHNKYVPRRLTQNIVPLVIHADTVPPKLTGIFPFSRFTPGGGVILQGINLGLDPGEITLLGEFPNGFLSLDKLQWGPTFAAGVVPYVSGVADQDRIDVQVVRSDGFYSNVLSGPFTASHETVILPGTVLKTITSSSIVRLGQSSTEPTIDAFAMSIVAASSGTDRFYVSLKNGWKYAGYFWGADEGVASAPFPDGVEPVGSSEFEISVNWNINFLGSTASYELYILVEGPIGGVPFK